MTVKQNKAVTALSITAHTVGRGSIELSARHAYQAPSISKFIVAIAVLSLIASEFIYAITA